MQAARRVDRRFTAGEAESGAAWSTRIIVSRIAIKTCESVHRQI